MGACATGRDRRAVGVHEVSAATGDRLTFGQAVNEIRDLLSKLSNAPHEEHFGPLCPICGLVTSLQAKLEDWRDG